MLVQAWFSIVHAIIVLVHTIWYLLLMAWHSMVRFSDLWVWVSWIVLSLCAAILAKAVPTVRGMGKGGSASVACLRRAKKYKYWLNNDTYMFETNMEIKTTKIQLKQS